MRFYPRIAMTCTPLRLSFVGGGTDLAAFYRLEDGGVVSTTIDKFVYVTVKRHGELFGENYRLNYYDSEHAQKLDDIQNDIMRECLRLVPVEEPLYVSTVADIPSSSGLGSSSAFAVGLLQALHIMRGDRVSKAQLAEEACHIEIDVLKHPIGKQDQYAAAFGGLNYIRFHTDDSVTIEPQRLVDNRVADIFSHIMMFWTKIPRSSSEILNEQKAATPNKMDNLRTMLTHCDSLRSILKKGDNFCPTNIGALLDETWRMKKEMASTISSAEIDGWYERAIKAGAVGGKILGAGGGGFLMLIVPPDRQAAVTAALPELKRLCINYEATGTHALIPVGH